MERFSYLPVLLVSCSRGFGLDADTVLMLCFLCCGVGDWALTNTLVLCIAPPYLFFSAFNPTYYNFDCRPLHSERCFLWYQGCGCLRVDNFKGICKKGCALFDGCFDVRRCPVHLNAPLALHAWTCGVGETCCSCKMVVFCSVRP